MTTAWPDYLPSVAMRGSYSETPEVSTTKSELAGSGQLLRRRTKLPSSKLSFSMLMTTTQVGLFFLFYQSELIDGIRPFTFTDPRTQTTATYTFVNSPVVSAITYGQFNVTLPLRRMP